MIHSLTRRKAILQKCLCCEQVERRFKWLWADHGDDISRQYAGTGALKSGFTRTGKRTYWGILDDGIKSAVRYYVNNFSDGRKQDASDLVTGNYALSKGRATYAGMQNVQQRFCALNLSPLAYCV